MQFPAADRFRQALATVGPSIHSTPLLASATLRAQTGVEVLLKAEFLQRTGSYKIRGPLNVMARLGREALARGVICSSAGNHAQGVAYAAKAHGIPAVVVMAAGATPGKVAATRAYGAEVVQHGRIWDDAYEKSLLIQEERQLRYIHPFDDPLLVEGQGTLGLEILRDFPEADCLIVPIGGGGLISGVAMAAKALKPNIRVVGVEASGAPAMSLSLEAGRRVRLEQVSSVIDGLVVKQVGEYNFEVVTRFVDEIVLVSDAEIFATVLWLMERCKFVVEGAAAATVCALLQGRVRISPGEKVVCVLSGGNLNVGQLQGLSWN